MVPKAPGFWLHSYKMAQSCLVISLTSSNPQEIDIPLPEN